MDVTTDWHGAGGLVTVTGTLVDIDRERLRSTLEDALRPGATRVAVDLTHVDGIDGDVASVLLDAASALRERGGRLGVVADKRARTLLEASGLAVVFELYPSRADAIAALAS